MRTGTIKNNDVIICPSARLTVTAGERMRGLLGSSPLLAGEALWIAPCNSVHCWFMGYAIDVIYVDTAGRVLRCIENLRPWGVSACWRAAAVIELLAGELQRLQIKPGDRLCFNEV